MIPEFFRWMDHFKWGNSDQERTTEITYSFSSDIPSFKSSHLSINPGIITEITKVKKDTAKGVVREAVETGTAIYMLSKQVKKGVLIRENWGRWIWKKKREEGKMPVRIFEIESYCYLFTFLKNVSLDYTHTRGGGEREGAGRERREFFWSGLKFALQKPKNTLKNYQENKIHWEWEALLWIVGHSYPKDSLK